MRPTLLALAVVTALACPWSVAGQESSGAVRSSNPREAIEFSPASPFIRIYAVQYARHLTDRDELLIGGAYTNVKYDFGRSHAPTAIIGYRRYVWRQVHVEYQLWPSYNWFYSA